MKWSKTPRRIVPPRPAPGRNPSPMAVVIGSPSSGNRGGHPHVTVLRHVAPFAVIVEILVANYVTRDVADGLRLFFAAILVPAPIVKIIFALDGFYVWPDFIYSTKHARLSGTDCKSLTTCRYFAFAPTDGHRRQIT